MRRKKIYITTDLDKWLLQGVSNSAFFHSVNNGRESKYTMYTLQDGDTQIHETNDLLLHATKYYKSIFGHWEGNLMRFSRGMWLEDENISLEEKQELDKPFTEQKVKKVIDVMVKNMGPSPDENHVEFYQTC